MKIKIKKYILIFLVSLLCVSSFDFGVSSVEWTVGYQPLDALAPNITINFAGNLSDIGGPYWRPPEESVILMGDWANGYYTNNSRQTEDWMYINLTLEDADGVSLGNVTLQLLKYNSSSGQVWTNWTYQFTNPQGNWWELNTSSTNVGGIQTNDETNYSFNIVVNDTAGNSNMTWWNKTVDGGGTTRRYVRLNNTETSKTYTPFYLYNMSYDQPEADDRGDKDFGTGDVKQVGQFLPLLPDADVQIVFKNNSKAGGWLNFIDVVQNYAPEHFILQNMYYHVWWTTNPAECEDVDRIGLIFPGKYSFTNATWSATDYLSASRDNSRSRIEYNFAPQKTSWHLATNYIGLVTPYLITDNNFWQLGFGIDNVSYNALEGAEGNASMISNRSFTSFIAFNLPSQSALALSDSDSDDLNDFVELYITYTNPWLYDTDNDDVGDYWENLSGSDPNNWSESYNISLPNFLNPNPVGLDIEYGTNLTTLDVVDPGANMMNLSWWSNSSGTWYCFGSNSSIFNGTYTQINDNFTIPNMTYYWSGNVTNGLTWYNHTYNFTLNNTGDGQPPQFSDELPKNASDGRILNNLYFEIYAWDPEGNVFNITIEGSEGTVYYRDAQSNNTFGTYLNDLAFSTIYYVWVNATDYNRSNNVTYWFRTIDYQGDQHVIQKVTDQDHYYDTYHNNQRKIVRDSDGILHAVWAEVHLEGMVEFFSDINYAYSTDDGLTWTNETVYTATYPDIARTPAIAIDSENNLHVVFAYCDNFSMNGWANYSINYTKHNATTHAWSSPVAITLTDYDYWFPAIAINITDCLWVISVNTSANYRLMWNSSQPFGSSWNTGGFVNTTLGECRYPSIAIGLNGRKHLVAEVRKENYTGGAHYDYDIYYIRNNDSGEFWWPPMNLTATGIDAVDHLMPCIATYTNGTPAVVWTRKQYEPGVGPSDAYYDIMYGEDMDGMWTTPDSCVKITNDTGNNNSYYPSISIDMTNKSWVAYNVNQSYAEVMVRSAGTWFDFQVIGGFEYEQWDLMPNMLWSTFPFVDGSPTCMPNYGYAFSYVRNNHTFGIYLDEMSYFNFTSGPTWGTDINVTLLNLTDYYSTYWKNSSMTWGGDTKLGDVVLWCNGSGLGRETIDMNITVGQIPMINDVDLYVGDLTVGSTVIGASNMTIFVSTDNTTFYQLLYDAGNGAGIPLDGGCNMTINWSTWGFPTHSPWDYNGDQSTLTSDCRIYIRIKLNVSMLPSGGNYTNNSVWYVYLKNETIGTLAYDTFRGNLNLTATNTLPYVVWTYPADGATEVPMPLINISAYVTDDNGDSMNITWWTTKGDDNWTTWYNEIGWNYSTHNGTNMSNQTFNNSQRYNTRWRWGNTTYTWGVNISDGLEWANYTFSFTTTSISGGGNNERYDVTTDTVIDVSDLSVTWGNRGGVQSYLGLYDVSNDGVIDVSDLSVAWGNRD